MQYFPAYSIFSLCLTKIMMLSKGFPNQGNNRKKCFNKSFEKKVGDSSLTEEEKRKRLFEVFDILLAIKKEKSSPSEEEKTTQ